VGKGACRRGCTIHFDCLCQTVNATAGERENLAWHLAQFRARKTFEGLRHG
jgi:hypothetical protein